MSDVDVAVTVEGAAVVVNDDSGVREAAETVVLNDAGVTDPAAVVVAVPAGKAARNMTAHEKIFKAADILADDFYNVSGREAVVTVTRSATLRGARVTFDIGVTVEGVEVLAAARTGLTMEESLTFLGGMSAMVATIAALSPEVEAIDVDLINAAA